MMKKIISAVLIVFMTVLSTGIINIQSAFAASVTSFSDVLSNETASTVSNHTINFTTPTGVAAGATIILTFSGSTSIPAGLTFADIDVKDNGTNVTLAASPSGATWGAVRTSGTVITLTNGTTAVTAGHTITVLIGTNATNQSTGTNQITNDAAGTTTLALTGTFGDTGSTAYPIIANSIVTVTATVNPTISFSLGSTSVNLGTLSTGSTATTTHTISAATNASGGFAISYNGATLTSGSNTIAAWGAQATPTLGTPQFGLNIGTAPTTNAGTCTAATSYNDVTKYAYTASTATTITNETAPADCVFTAKYAADISSTTAAGSYTTAITYIATGTF